MQYSNRYTCAHATFPRDANDATVVAAMRLVGKQVYGDDLDSVAATRMSDNSTRFNVGVWTLDFEPGPVANGRISSFIVRKQ